MKIYEDTFQDNFYDVFEIKIQNQKISIDHI